MVSFRLPGATKDSFLRKMSLVLEEGGQGLQYHCASLGIVEHDEYGIILRFVYMSIPIAHCPIHANPSETHFFAWSCNKLISKVFCALCVLICIDYDTASSTIIITTLPGSYTLTVSKAGFGQRGRLSMVALSGSVAFQNAAARFKARHIWQIHDQVIERNDMENHGNIMFLVNDKVCYVKLASEFHVFLFNLDFC